MAETIFSKIIRGEIPCHKVYEDAHVLALLDIFPLSHGHTLVIPKEAAATLDQLSDEASAAVGRVLPRLVRAVLAASGAKACNILQNNGELAHQAVMHVHFHIIPKFAGGSVDTGTSGDAGGLGEGLGIGWKAGTLDGARGAALAQAIAARLG